MKKNQRNKHTGDSAGNMISNICAIIAVVISVISLIFGIYTHSEQNAEKQPIFLLGVKNTEVTDANKELEIYNTGGKIYNARLTPYMHLEIELCKQEEKFASYVIEFSDFYSSYDCFYDMTNSRFLVNEDKAYDVYVFLNDLQQYLIEEDIKINLYAIKHYFDISYTNYRGENCVAKYEVLNNYNYYFWHNDADEGFKRYFNDNALRKIENIPQFNSRLPVVNPKSIAERIIEDIEFVDYSDDWEDTMYQRASAKKGKYFLTNERGLIIGLKESKEEK